MENEQNGFTKLTAFAGDSLEPGSVADQASQRLKTVGIDADDAMEMVEERATHLQDMLMEEIRERPFRALGWAVAAGFVLGIMSVR